MKLSSIFYLYINPSQTQEALRLLLFSTNYIYNIHTNISLLNFFLTSSLLHKFSNQQKAWNQRRLRNKSVEHLLHATVVTKCLLYAYDITPTNRYSSNFKGRS